MRWKSAIRLAATGFLALAVASVEGSTQGENCLGCDEACCWKYHVGYTQCSMDVAAPGCGTWCTNGETECPESHDDDLSIGLDGVAFYSQAAEARGLGRVLRFV